MALNLSRNTRVFFTTNVDANGLITDANVSSLNQTLVASATSGASSLTSVTYSAGAPVLGTVLTGTGLGSNTVITAASLTGTNAGTLTISPTTSAAISAGTLTGTFSPTATFTVTGASASAALTIVGNTANAGVVPGMVISSSATSTIPVGTWVTTGVGYAVNSVITTSTTLSAAVTSQIVTATLATAAQFVGSISTGGILTVTNVISGAVVPGMYITNTQGGIPAGTYVVGPTAAGANTSASGLGTWQLNTNSVAAAVNAQVMSGSLVAGFNSTNTQEINVLDGYSFSQSNNQQTITLSEAGSTPVRGQRSFNTQLNPVDFSFSTYLRPYKSGNIIPAERVLWNALFGNGNLDETGITIATNGITRSSNTQAAVTVVASANLATTKVIGDVINIQGASDDTWNNAIVLTSDASAGQTTMYGNYVESPPTGAGTSAVGTSIKAYTGQWGSGATQSYVTSANSNRQTLVKFGMIFSVDNQMYAIDNCALDQCSIDFGLDAIAMAAWTGKGTALKALSNLLLTQVAAGAAAPSTSANYITNKLSTMTLERNLGGLVNSSSTSTQYGIAITGGNITIANNLNYLTPSNLGVLNKPIGYYTGTRAITGNVTAYLKTGTTGTFSAKGDAGSLLNNLLSATGTDAIEPKYRLQLEMGGASNTNRVEFELSGANLQIPQVNVADVVATTINFTAQGFGPAVVGAAGATAYDITQTNDIQIRYYSA